MNNLIRVAIIVGGSILGYQSAFAGYNVNDLYMGFQNSAGSGTADYIINLGPASGIVGGSSVVNLTTYVPSFPDALLGDNSGDTILGGVVGGSQGVPYIYYTQSRSSLGTPSVAGSMTPDPDDNIEGAISALNSLDAPAAYSNVVDTAKSWEGQVDNTLVNYSFAANAKNPDSPLNIGGIIYEDLYYQNQDSTTPVYEGYFTIDLTGDPTSPMVSFTPKNAAATLTQPITQSVSKVGSTVTVVSSNAVSTHTYQLQYTVSLNPINWISVGSSQVAASTLVTNTDTTATGSKRFYRVKAQ